MSIIKIQGSKLCSVVHRTINCQTNDNLINIVNPKIDSILPLVPRVESLIKQVQILSSYMTAKFDKLPMDFQDSNVTEYSQQLKHTVEAVIVIASTIIESQSTIVGGKDRQQPSLSSSGELSEDLRKRKIDEWISHLIVSHGEKEQEYDIVSELTPDDSVSRIGLKINNRSQQSGIPGSSLGADKSVGTAKNRSTGRRNSIEKVFDRKFTSSSDIEGIFSSSEEESNETISENTLTECRPDHKVDTSYDEKSVKGLLALLGANTEATERNSNDLLLDLANMEAGQGLRSNSNIVGTLLYLLRQGANINTIDFKSTTPLYHASRRGNRAVVELLCERNADFNIKCKEVPERYLGGWTALHIAAFRGHTPVVEVLLKNGVEVEQKTECHWFYTALQLAAREGRVSTVQCLLKAGASINDTTASGWTALHFASSGGHVGVVETLLKAGAYTDAEDWDRTPLICASENGFVGVVKTLMKAGASLDSISRNGNSALMASAFAGHKTIIELLLTVSVLISRTLTRSGTM